MIDVLRRPLQARQPQWLLAALAAILIVSATLRFVWLDRIPLGWHHDEALMGVMAGSVYRGEEHPIFFRQYLGQEPLYIYLAAGTIALLGGDQGVLPLRLTSAAIGLATVLLTFVLGRQLFGTRAGLIAMALAGVSFWQVMSARMAYRSITQPLLEGIAVALLWRARTRGGLRWYVLSGIALGGVLYTYLGARAFPGVFVGFALWQLVSRGRPSRGGALQSGVLALAAIAVAVPLAVFFLSNPGTFSARMEQVFIFRPEINGGDPWPLMAESARKMLQLFTISGEPMWRYNIPGRPLFVGALALAFYLGVVALLVRLWRRDDAAALLFIWFAVMCFPALLSWESGAYTLRAMGLVPALYFVPAVGLDWACSALGRLWRPAVAGAAVAIAAAVLVDGAWTVRDYFVVWAPSFGASWEDGADGVAQARFLVQAARPDAEEILVGSEYYHYPVLAQLARPVYPYLRWFDGRQSVVFSPSSQRPALYVLGFNGMPLDAIDELFPSSARVGAEYFLQGVDGDEPPPLLLAYRLTPEQTRAQVDRLRTSSGMRPVAGRVPGFFAPLAARIDGPVRPGGELTAVMVWQVEQRPPPGEYQMLVHLVDHRFQKVSGVDTLGYPPEEWQPGDVVWSRFVLPVPKEAPAGRYSVQAALYDRVTGQRLPIEGSMPGVPALFLGDVRVVDQPVLPSRRVGARLGEGMELIGIDPPARVAGGQVALTVYWQTEQKLDRNYTAFVQVLDASGHLVAQSDHEPAGGALPTSSWLPGEPIRDEHRLTLPPGLSPGSYRLIAGLYSLPDVRRLSVAGGGDFVELTTLSVPLP